MKKWNLFFIVALSGFWLAPYASVQADFYRYLDQDGNIRFTDDLSTVPPDQRPQVKPYAAYESPLPAGKPPQEGTLPARESLPAGLRDELAKEAEALRERSKALEKEHQGLVKEREALEKQQQSAQTDEEKNRLNEKVKAFNEKQKQYEESRKACAEKIQAFNARIEKYESEHKASPEDPQP